MQTYIIFDYKTDKEIGEIEANGIMEAERKAAEKYNVGSLDIYAITKDD